ncbi:unnamed protein product [Agarophyton chilense]
MSSLWIAFCLDVFGQFRVQQRKELRTSGEKEAPERLGLAVFLKSCVEMDIKKKISNMTEVTLSKTFGDEPIRSVNMKLTRNIGMFAGAIVFFKVYGHLFEV